MNSVNIITAFNILEYRKFSLFICFKVSIVNMFDLQDFKEAFGYFIIPASS